MQLHLDLLHLDLCYLMLASFVYLLIGKGKYLDKQAGITQISTLLKERSSKVILKHDFLA